jgi:predicted ATPase
MGSEQGTLFELNELEVPVERYPAAFLARPEHAPRLKIIEIEALKGIDHLVIELDPPLTMLTGPNNSGKSTILQAILLGFDCFRRCLDTSTWRISSTGRAVSELDFLHVNHPKDLWYRHIWKPSRGRERYVRVALTFEDGFRFVARIRFLYGALNIGIEEFTPNPTPELIRSIVSSAPILIPATPGPQAHEPVVALAQLHYTLGTGEPARVLHNILLQLQNDDEYEASWDFVSGVVRQYFDVGLEEIDFDERLDLEIRAPYSEADFSLDIVSGGSGLNQILQLAAIIAWRRPGIVLLDEPDAHLHTALQTKMLDFLYALSSQYGLQIILSTHSRDLISHAPLNTIIPVDLSREHLAPIQSMEHLLLEFERQGTVSNVDIALLYQTKKCLFVEGPTDSRLLPKIANRLGRTVFQGKSQIVTFEFEGVDNLRIVPRVVELFERMIGAKLTWAVVRDRDANLPEVIDEYVEQAGQLGITNLHIWETYSLENLLLQPELVLNALNVKYPDFDLEREDVVALLDETMQAVRPEVGGVFITKTQTAYRAFGKDNPFDSGASNAYQFLDTLDTFERRLKYYPGKKVFGQFVQLLQERYSRTLRLDEIVEVLSPENVPEDINRLMSVLDGL